MSKKGFFYVLSEQIIVFFVYSADYSDDKNRKYQNKYLLLKSNSKYIKDKIQ